MQRWSWAAVMLFPEMKRVSVLILFHVQFLRGVRLFSALHTDTHTFLKKGNQNYVFQAWPSYKQKWTETLRGSESMYEIACPK